MNPPWDFVMLQYFENILPLIDSLCCAVEMVVNIMGSDDTGNM